jgi:hypothetical protein
MKLSLPPSITTPAALARCLDELKRYQDAVWTSDLAQRTSGQARRNAPVKGLSHATTELLGSVPNPAQPSVDSIKEAIEYLEAVQREAKVIHVTTVVELTTDAQQSVVQWFRQLIEAPSLVSFVTDPQIGGGAVVRTPYHSHDFSYATRLKQEQSKLLQGLQRG